MGIQINGSTDRITAIDGTIDFVSNIGNIGLITASRYELLDSITIGAGSTIIKTSNGNLGLGIDPSDIDSIGKALNIASSTGGAIYLQDTDSPTTKFAAISYNGATAGLQIHAHHGSSFIDLGTDGTPRLRIDSSGNVMIGRTSASKKFSVRETSTSSGVYYNAQIGGSNHLTGYAVGIAFDPEGYTARTKIGIVAEGTSSGYSRGKLHFLLDSANDSGEATLAESRMTILDDGNIGINATSPNVSAFNSDARVLTISGPKRGILELRGSTQAADIIGSIRFFSANNNEAEITSVADGSYNGDLRFTTNGGERLRISSTGLVGIGTITNWSPYKLQVAGGLGIAESANTGQQSMSITNNAIQTLAIGVAYNALLLNKDGGNVLIGTATNSGGNKLYVVDNHTETFVNPSDSILRIENANTSGTTGQASISFTSKTSGSNADSAIVSQAEDASGNARLEFWTDTANGMSEKMAITSGGLVGINRAPVYSGLFGGSQKGIHIGGTTAPFLRITSDTGSQGDLILQAGNSGGDVQMGNLNDAGDITFWTNPSGASGVAESMRIHDNGAVTKPRNFTFIVESNGTTITTGWNKLTGLTLDSTHCNWLDTNYWDGSNQRFTPPVNGTYLFYFGGWGNQNAGNASNRYATCFRISGGSFTYISGGTYPNVDAPLNGHSISQKLTTSQYVELYYYSSMTGTWGGSHRIWWGASLLG